MMTSVNTETCDPVDLAALREVFASRPEAVAPAGWQAVQSFEIEHGIELPEPYRTFVAEICDGLREGPPYYGLLPLAQTPSDWGPDRPKRLLAEPFPLTEAWLWEETDEEGDEEALSERELEARMDCVFDHAGRPGSEPSPRCSRTSANGSTTTCGPALPGTTNLPLPRPQRHELRQLGSAPGKRTERVRKACT
ncbi:SMI1/KNR4 family protein [Streptomyces flaveolus]|jgi:hypothetical protein|uniref:SMI1/KNR4 family protein n=1 Tax=Streptomyces flaveolus TaxID=67297 RepID=UPI003807CA06